MKKRLFIGMVFAMIFMDGFSQAVGTPFFPFSLPKGLVMSKTGRIWMDKNLGATRVATSASDTLSFGYLFQWGRAKDGHQERYSAPFNSASNNFLFYDSYFIGNPPVFPFDQFKPVSSDTPGHPYFIHLAPSSDPTFYQRGNSYSFYVSDWRNPQNGNLWQGISGTNNPCPSGFRIPTIQEWQEEKMSWGKIDTILNSGFLSYLKLPSASIRNFNNSVIQDLAVPMGVPPVSNGISNLYYSNINLISGNYWSSTVSEPIVEYDSKDPIVSNRSIARTKYKAYAFKIVNYEEYDDFLEENVLLGTSVDSTLKEMGNGLSVRCILDQNIRPYQLTLGDYSKF